jgi:hypothetical protein
MGAISDGINTLDLTKLTKVSKGNFKQAIINALFRSLRGKSRLEGVGDLVKLFPYLENQANKQGAVGVIYKGGKLLPVSVANLKERNGKKVIEYSFSRNPYYQYSELKLQLPEVVNGEPTGEAVEEIFYPDIKSAGGERNKLFAILENDLDLCPDLVGIETDLEKLETILDCIFHDIVASKKKYYFIFSQDPDKEDWAKVGKLLEKDIMGYIAMTKSYKPDAKAGKAGIDPNTLQLQTLQPENKGRDLWKDYQEWKQEILWKYGIRFDTLEEKKERASVSEVQQSSSYFDDIENERRSCRINFIQWCIENWGKEALNVDYTFTYGKKNN